MPLHSAQSGHVIEDEATPLTARANLNFTGAGVTATDSGGKTVVTIPGGGSVANATVAIQYVATNGSDGNDGLTWGTAKLTIPAAIASLPLGADATTPIGTVELGAGTFAVSSYSRTDTVGVTNGSTTVTDASITSQDVGAYVINPSWFAAGAYIVSVNPGVSFVLSHAPTNTGSPTATIHRPAIKLPANVTLRGQGASGIKDSAIDWSNLQAVTKIQDNGTGITIAIKPGTANDPTAVRSTIERMAVWGNASNVAGIWSANLFQSRIQEVDCAYHGVAGIAVSGNWEGGVFEDLLLTYNGSATATIITGGFVNWGNSPTAMAFRNIFFLHNYGFGAWVGHNGAAFYDCTFGDIDTSLYGGAQTGVHVNAQGGDLGCVAFDNCEFDITAGPQHVTLQGPALFKSCLFQGGSVSAYAIKLEAGAAPVVVIGCVFYGHSTASIYCNSGVYPAWLGCTSTDPKFITPSPDVAASAAPGVGASSAVNIGGFTNPMTTQDDLIVGGSAGAAARLAKGGNGQVLTVDGSGHVTWQNASSGFANPMTTQDDLIIGGASGAAARLAKGTDGQVLTVDPTTHHLVWATPSVGGGSVTDRAAVSGLKAWTWDPGNNNNTVVGSGGVLLTAAIVVPTAMTVSKIHAYLAIGGSALTVAYGALWTADGATLIAKTASQTTAWAGSPGLVSPTLVAQSGQSLTLAAGVYIVAVIGTGTSSPAFASWNTPDANYTNIGTADPAYRMAYLFPADNSTSVLTGMTPQLKAPWMGLS
jgi:hypothetical protein